jgi:anti-sigma B factor antagonist
MSSKHGSHWLEREDFDAVTVVRLRIPKALDDDTIRVAFEPISTVCGIGRSLLVLNLTAVEYLPSMGVGKLVMLNRRVQAANGRMALCCLSPAVKEVLESTHLNDLFNIYATEQEALRSFS